MDSNQQRVGADVSEWCSCKQCISMPTAIECQCCCELSRITERLNSLECIGVCITNTK